MPLSINSDTTIQDLKTYSENNVGTNQKIYAKSSTQVDVDVTLHGATFKGDTTSYNLAKTHVLDVLTNRTDETTAKAITDNVFGETPITGGKLKLAADSAFVSKELKAVHDVFSEDGTCSTTSKRDGSFDDTIAGRPFANLVTTLETLAGHNNQSELANAIDRIVNDLNDIDKAVAKEFISAALSSDNRNLRIAIRSNDASDLQQSLVREVGQNPTKDPVEFGKFPGKPNGVTVEIGDKLGQGGMGGAVYMAVDTETGDRYAVKYQPGIEYQLRPGTYSEAAHTPSSLGSQKIDKDMYTLLKLGGKVDFSKLGVQDFREVFHDLGQSHNASENYMTVEVSEFGFTHEDIHRGNFMMIDGKFNLIDYGKTADFSSDSVVRATSSFTTGFVDGFTDYEKENGKPLQPELQGTDLKMTEVNCITLTRQLILNVVYQTVKDNQIENAGLTSDFPTGEHFYAIAKGAEAAILEQKPEVAGNVTLLLDLYSTLMNNVIDGKSFTAEDCVQYFTTDNKGVEQTRDKSHTV